MLFKLMSCNATSVLQSWLNSRQQALRTVKRLGAAGTGRFASGGASVGSSQFACSNKI